MPALAPVLIVRCPDSPIIGEITLLVQAALKDEAITPRVSDGFEGELIVLVNGRDAYRLAGHTLPTAEQIVEAVKSSLPIPAPLCP